MVNKTLFIVLVCILATGALGMMGCDINESNPTEASLTDADRAQFREIAGNSWTGQEKDDVLHFLLSLEAAKTATSQTHLNAPSPSGTREQMLQAFRSADEKNHPHFRKALAEGKQVSDPVLDKMHPQLKHHFRSEYIKYLEYRVANTGENWKPFSEGQQFFEAWHSWFNEHFDKLDIPYEIEI